MPRSEPSSTSAPTTAQEATPVAPTTTPTESSSLIGASESSLVVGAEYEGMVAKICEMGFEDQQVRKALRAAFNNPDRAVDFLFNGIPNVEDVPMASEQARAPASAGGADVNPSLPVVPPRSAESASRGSDGGTAPTSAPFNMFAPDPSRRTSGGSGSGAGGEGPLDFLRRLPQFNLTRRAIQSNPQLLPALLEQLAVSQPNLLSLIDANQEEFQQLIQEPLSPEDEAAADAELAAAGAMGRRSGSEGPPRTVIHLTPQEQEQIQRLENLVGPMGLDRVAVLEAWLACDRNEELAANYLLNNLEDFLEQSGEGEGGAGRQ